MARAAITIVGLGPGAREDLTQQAYTTLAQAAERKETVYFRTFIHPLIEPLKQELPDLPMESFDRLYDEAQEWEALYQRMAEEISARAAAGPVIYAVPGHPLIGDTSVQLLLQWAREQGREVQIVAGLSFLEPVCSALQLDPLAAGLQILDAASLAVLNAEEIAGKLIPTAPLLVAQLYNRRLASAVKLALSECYPDEWRVSLVRVGGEVVELPLYELDRNNLPDYLTTLYVPPLDELTALRVPETLRYITMRLRREPDGCPWDRRQTHQSLVRYVLEEAYEVAEAIEEGEMEQLADELGDLLLQVYLHAEIARQEGEFAIGDVFEHINAKLIRRHPHVFGDVQVSGAGQVVQNWEAIKRAEREAAGKNVAEESALDRVTLALPALVVAQEYQKRAASAGFNYRNLPAVLEKLAEEIRELAEAQTAEERHEEFGDLLFMVARAARELDIDAEEALRHANRKFRARFQALERRARQAGRELSSYNREELRALWQQAKVDVRQGA